MMMFNDQNCMLLTLHDFNKAILSNFFGHMSINIQTATVSRNSFQSNNLWNKRERPIQTKTRQGKNHYKTTYRHHR